MASHFGRNEIRYQKSRESRLFQYILYACTIACLSFIPLYKQKFYKSFTRYPFHRNRRKANNYHGQYLWQKAILVKRFVNRQEIQQAAQDLAL